MVLCYEQAMPTPGPSPDADDADPSNDAGLAELIERLSTSKDERWRILVEHVPGVLYIDLPQNDFETLYVSPQVFSILGLTPEQWANDPQDAWIAHLHPDDRDGVLAAYERFLASSDADDLADYRMIRPDGSVVWIRDRARVFRDRAGKAVLEHGLMVDVTELKDSQALVSAQAERLLRAEAIGRSFTDVVLQERGLDGILQLLAGLTRNPVVLEDTAHRPVSHATHDASINDVLAHWEEHSRLGHPDAAPLVVRSGSASPQCVWVTVPWHDEAWARLHLLEVERTADEIDRVALDRASAALGIVLLAEREANALVERARGGLLFDILGGRLGDPDEILRRAGALGIDLSAGPLLAIAAEPLPGEGTETGRDADRAAHRARTALVRAVRTAAAAMSAPLLLASGGERVLALLVVGGTRPFETAPTRASSLIQDDEALVGIEIVIGAGWASDLAHARPALREASEAADAGARRRSPGLIRSGDLGVDRLLLNLDGPALAAFVEAELAPILDRDARGGTPLLETLTALLAVGGRKSEAARVLHIGRRTLYQRLARVEALLGKDLDQQDVRIGLEVAIRALEILRGESPRKA